MKYRIIIILTFITAGYLSINSCKSVENFVSPEGPRYAGNYAIQDTNISLEEIKIVSFNIEYAIEIEQAIKNLRLDDSLKDADIILLQEMDDEGSEQIASALGFNYVYYPANRNTNNKLFGLAILSKWQIISDQKIILPYETPVNERRRMAIMADIKIGDALVCVYNVHTATQSMGRSKRHEQFRFILDKLKEHQSHHPENNVILGGDFNTFLNKDREYLIELCSTANLQCVSENIGATWQKFGFLDNLALDHFFSRGFTKTASGKLASTEASDHLPIWVTLKIK